MIVSRKIAMKKVLQSVKKKNKNFSHLRLIGLF